MKNSFGTSVSVTLLGESHGPMIGAVLDGLAPGIPVDETFIAAQMAKRKNSALLSTARREEDRVLIVSGVYEGKTTGTPITLLIENKDQKSKDYDKLLATPRPGHADLTALYKYHGFADPRGGGHFSGRITAGLVAAGAIALTALKQCGIRIGTHIASCAGIRDREFNFARINEELDHLNQQEFAVLLPKASKVMRERILAAREDLDSVGGVLETVVTGLPVGVGEPWFDTVEGVLSHLLFSIPAVKGVEFGAGFSLASMMGSAANDEFMMDGERIVTDSNHCGGILGGITNGMPLVFRCAVKPTPSIYKEQNTVDVTKKENTTLSIEGRHDPAIVHRARVVADSVTALGLCDLLALRYGTDFPALLAKENQ